MFILGSLDNIIIRYTLKLTDIGALHVSSFRDQDYYSSVVSAFEIILRALNRSFYKITLKFICVVDVGHCGNDLLSKR